MPYYPPASGSSSGITGVVDYRTATATITIPTGATKCDVTLVGGGGGGGGPNNGAGVGGAGGAGGTLLKYLSGLTPGNTLALTVGVGGAGGAINNNNGVAGGDTVLASGTQTITTLTATKGAFGAGGASGVGASGAGGLPTNGDFNIKGQAGLSVRVGADDLLSQYGISWGGSSKFGAGSIAAAFVVTTLTGPAATVYGAGGAGGIGEGGSAGAAGCAIFEWYA